MSHECGVKVLSEDNHHHRISAYYKLSDWHSTLISRPRYMHNYIVGQIIPVSFC